MPHTIYLHVNTVNGKKYVGQTKLTVEGRWARHLSAARSHIAAKTLFTRAICKHGEAAFAAYVLEVLETLEEANESEIKWIAFHRSTEREFGYNLDAGGRVKCTHPDTLAKLSAAQRRRLPGSPSRVKAAASIRAFYVAHPEARRRASQRSLARSPETSAKRSASLREANRLDPTLVARRTRGGFKMSADTIARRTASRVGFKHSPEAIAKMRESHRNSVAGKANLDRIHAARVGTKLSSETRAKMSESHRLRNEREVSSGKVRIGRKLSTDDRAKVSAALKNHYADPANRESLKHKRALTRQRRYAELDYDEQ